MPKQAPAFRILIFVAILLCGAWAPRAWGNPASEALRRSGYDQAYNLDRQQAMATFQRAVDADPDDSAAHRAMAVVSWLDILFKQGSILVDDYLGSVTTPSVRRPTPPPDLERMFRTHIDTALALAERRLRANPDNASAHYDVGAAVGQMAAYAATAEGRVVGGIAMARRALSEQERVITLDPRRKDAGLIIGTYRYAVATLAFPLRWLAYLVGFGGGRERGISMIEEAAAYPGDSQAEATFALVLVYNREQRYDAALAVLRQLQQQYPGNRLLWLEAGATAVRARRFSDADALLSHGLAMASSHSRRFPGYCCCNCRNTASAASYRCSRL
jgi:tetratricopeptide (TPR) repeat protein